VLSKAGAHTEMKLRHLTSRATFHSLVHVTVDVASLVSACFLCSKNSLGTPKKGRYCSRCV